MRKIFAAVFTVSLFACTDSDTKTARETTENTEVKANTPANTYGFTPAYSASFVMDSAKNTETVLALWKEWKDGDLSQSRSHFADTVSFFMADGTSMSGLTEPCKGRTDCVKFALGLALIPCNQSKIRHDLTSLTTTRTGKPKS